MSKRRKEERVRGVSSELPLTPTGFELLDLQWAEVAPYADAFISPEQARPEWGTLDAVRQLAVTHARLELARLEAASSIQGRTITRVRQRSANVLERAFAEQSVLIANALAVQAASRWPKANSPQVMLVIRDLLRKLLRAAVAELEARDPGLYRTAWR